MAFLGPSLRRVRVSERPAARVGVALLVSVAANALLVLVAWRMGAFELARPMKEQRVVLAPLTADQWSHNRAITGQPPPRAQPVPTPPPPAVAQAPKKPPEEKPQGQIVDVTPSKDSTPPKDSKYLAEHDSTVQKETRSRDQGTRVFKERAPAVVEGGERKNRPAGDGGDAAETRDARRGSNAPAGTGAEKSPTPPAEKSDALAMLERGRQEGLQPPDARRLLPPGSAAPRREDSQGAPGLPGAPLDAQRKSGDARLLPSAASMSRVMAGPSNDDLRGVEEGDVTALNTRAFKYAGFWNRFKQDVASQWRPMIAYDERDPHRTTYAARDRETALVVVLDANGGLKSVKVLQSCGLDFLDREAVRAITAAAPFPNPPSGVVDERGEIKIPFTMAVLFDRVRSMRPIYPPGYHPEE